MRQQRVFIVTAIILTLYVLPSTAGNIYKCKDAKGNVTFSNVACPEATVEKEFNGTSKPQSARRTDDYYSPINQMRRINRRKAIARAKREEARRRSASIQQQKRQREFEETQRKLTELAYPEPVISYDAALQLALKKAGYRNYNNLTQMQRSRVDKEMAKYNYLPPEPRSVRKNENKPQTLHDPFTGRTMPRTGAGYTDPATGTFYHDAGGGVVNTKTGEFIPTN